MLTPQYLRVWSLAKAAAARLRHPMVTSEHLLYACLRLHDQKNWAIARELPVSAASVWRHLRDSDAPSEECVLFHSVHLARSAQRALDAAEATLTPSAGRPVGTRALMAALLSEKNGPVRSLLDLESRQRSTERKSEDA
jgi:ATP-dependent Clp protease ATP-binding subunit ClpA